VKLVSLRRLVGLSLSRDKRGAAFSAFGVAVGVGALVFFVALGLGVGKVVRENVFPIDSRLVDVVPPTLSLGNLLGGGKLDTATVERLAALPGVERVYRKMNVRVPAVSRYTGDFFGSRISMGLEILAVGVDPELVRQDVLLGDFTDPGPGKPIPGVASRRILEIYNKSFAPARKLPQLSSTMVVGFTFPVDFNRSFVAQVAPGPIVHAPVQVVGTSDRALLAGITVPLEVAVRLNKEAGVDAETFSAVSILAEDPSAVPGLVEAVKAMGLQIDDQERRLAENTGAAVALTTSALALLSVLICLLAGVNIAHALSASVRARAREIGVMRAVGASRRDVRNLVFGEAAAVGLAGTVVGVVGAWSMAKLVDVMAATYLPQFPYKPETFFAFPFWVLGGALAVGLLASLGGAYLPGRSAAAMDPARTLAG
jgi:putative ABC transport system permease protein